MKTTLKQEGQGGLDRKSAYSRLKLQRILVPLDFSGQSRQALAFAVPLAKQAGGKIFLIHVVEPVYPGAPFSGEVGVAPVDVRELVAACGEKLTALARELVPAELLGKTMVRTGRAYLEIINAADELGADLIALSTHGHSGLKHVLLGSTAEHVVRRAHCPVLTVRRQRGMAALQKLARESRVYPEGLPWRQILVPLDFSPTSLQALKFAVPLAKQSGARLLLLNVIEPNPYLTSMDDSTLMMMDTTVARDAKQRLPQVQRKFVPRSVRVASLVKRGRAASVIVETAQEKGVDLIVLSTHGHTGLTRLLMGSTAESVVRQANCPVFVTRKSQTRSAPDFLARN